MKKDLNIFLELFVLSPIIYIFGFLLYGSILDAKIQNLETKFPVKIIVDNKEEVFLRLMSLSLFVIKY